MYKPGVVYIWQNQKGEYAFLNGSETTVLTGPHKSIGVSMPSWWETDSLMPGKPNLNKWYIVAFPGDLREKNVPSGESSVLALFKQSELQPA